MPTYNIVVFAGDHCGPEVTAESLKVRIAATNVPPTAQTEYHSGPPSRRETEIRDQIQFPGTPPRRREYESLHSLTHNGVHLAKTSTKCSIDATGTPLSDEALTAAKNADAVILGAIGGPVRLESFFHFTISTPIRFILPSQNPHLTTHRNGAQAPSALNKASSPSENPSPHSGTSALVPSPPPPSSQSPHSKNPSAPA